MSGLGPILYLPWGASATWLLTFAKSEDGSAIDLTGATAVSFTLKTSVTLEDADADLFLSIAGGELVVVDALAGLVRATLTAAQHEVLRPYGPFAYAAKATLADGAVVIPDLLRGLFYNDLDSTLEQACDGAAITRLDAAAGTLTPTTPAMSNYLINRYDLTGLTGGTTAQLDGLPAAALALLQNGAAVRLFFPGSIVADFRLRANTGSETESAPYRIVCDNAPTRLWELVAVFKESSPCVWDAGLAKFKQILSTGGVLAQSDDADAFVLP